MRRCIRLLGSFSTISRSIPSLGLLHALAACLTAIAIWPSVLTASADGPFLPEQMFDYEHIALPDHFRQTALPGRAGRSGAAIDHDNTPAENPVTNAGATLGRVLFYDRRLSANGTVSCSSCHVQEHGFSDPRRLSVGFAQGVTRRHSMSLSNARFNRSGRFFWDERAATLEDQVLMPFQDRVEMGLTLDRLVEIVSDQPYYPPLFEAAFGSASIDSDRVARALAQFVRSLVSFESRYDFGRKAVRRPRASFPNFSEQENRGKRLFMTNEGGRTPCVVCHQTEAFVSGTPRGRNGQRTSATNNGLDPISPVDRGLAEFTMNGADTGRFKVPSLRNIAVSAPYMHDGRFTTLEQVVDHYSSGIQDHPNLDRSLRVWLLGPDNYDFAPSEKAALVAFLHTLTDQRFLADERFSDPFLQPDGPSITRIENGPAAGDIITGQDTGNLSRERPHRRSGF